MEELSKKLVEIQEILKDYNKFIHLFSKDEGVKTLAQLNKVTGDILTHVKMSGIKKIAHPTNRPLKPEGLFVKCGDLVSIRPVDDERTYLGVFVGDLALGSTIKILDDALICEWSGYNPAFYVPALKQVITGASSWWGRIDTEEDLRQISDLDIQSQWYVQALQQISDRSEKVDEPEESPLS